MKNMRKLFVMVLAVIMVMSLATTAFAATITIEGGASGSEYKAYRLLNATDGGAGKFAYTLNEKYTAVLQNISKKTEQADIIDYIKAQDEAAETRAFADAVYAAVKGMEADATTTTGSFADVAQGYYLIVETGLGTTATGETDTFSLVMLDTAGNEVSKVTTKEDVPSVEKKVEEKNDTTGATSWGDSADYDLNDTINFKITGTVSNKYADYKSYYYSFTDTMDAGLTYNGDAKVYVVNGEDENEIEGFTITTLANGFTATANLKELTLPEDITITGTTKIVVKYTATLNVNAVSGTSGNKNKVVLEYENNPYHEANPEPGTPDKPDEPGKTPEDINVVFTYDLVVDKVDGNGEALEGAGFTLYKQVPDGTDEDTDPDWVPVGDEIKGTETDPVTTFNFNKLDAGKYKLVETTVPDGYNKADDVIFEIVAVYDLTTDPDTLTDLQVKQGDTVVSEGEDPAFKVTLASGKIEADVKNLPGSVLPETGGMGTTLFYLFGGIMVLAAVVLLVTKKRMAV